MDHHLANGWRVGAGSGKPMKDWRATVRTWERTEFNRNGNQPARPSRGRAIMEFGRQLKEQEHRNGQS
jgi:hypothetical protein